MNACWQRWRRDLLFALAGAVVASAVLVPVGWSQIRAERRRAEAAEEEAAKQRAIAEEQTRIARQEAERAATERKEWERRWNDPFSLLEQHFMLSHAAPTEKRYVSWEGRSFIEEIGGEKRPSKLLKAIERIEALEAEQRKPVPNMPAPTPPSLP